MPRSPEVMRRLAERYAPVYLTHRPDYFGPKSKAWLRKHDYPQGPLLLSDLGGFVRGSGAFKSEMLADLRKRFPKIQVGIGDKISDAVSYHENGIKAYLILPIPERASAEAYAELAEEVKNLPREIEVVTHWTQIEKSVFEGVQPPREDVLEKIEAEAARNAAKEDSK